MICQEVIVNKKYLRKKCEHNRRKSICKECKGASICEHNRQKSICKECKGASICEHNRQKSQCKECKGTSICKHNRQKSSCKECGGSKLCKTYLCETTANPKYDNHCLRCFINLFPDLPVARNYKTKESSVVSFVNEQFPGITCVFDKAISGGCSKKRPDIMMDFGEKVIIIEVDENQHENYDCSCENKRLMELSQDIGHRHLIMIRFNPDQFFNQGKSISSCWGINKNGISTVKKSKQEEWKTRLETLKTQIQYWIDNNTNKMIEQVHLFFDL